jgi:mannose-6-phosphate isomerase
VYILEPVPHPTLWGGTKLSKYVKNNNEKLGHLYLVNGHKEMSNRILNGEETGKSLKEVFEMHKDEWNLSEYDEFPLTIALVDASESLSIQVHPDDVTAQRLEGKKIGKAESWLFLEAPKYGWIYDGCTLENREQVENAVKKGKMEEVTEHLSIRQNDYVYVEAGTLHAMTAGSLVYEIEYGSDYTYRFYDYGRTDANGNSRPLHIDKALEAIKPNVKSDVKQYKGDDWLSEENYEIRRVKGLDDYRNFESEIECLTVIEGKGNCDGIAIESGMSIILFPGEGLSGIDFEDVVIARLRR